MEELYILQLTNGKYYVGKSTDVNRRYKEHISGSGSAWTSIHKPKRILEIRPLKDEYDETNTTKELMKKYGVENVRGGAYSQVTLPNFVKQTLELERRSNRDACFKCGKIGHFAKNCNEDEDDVSSDEDEDNSSDEDEDNSSDEDEDNSSDEDEDDVSSDEDEDNSSDEDEDDGYEVIWRRRY